MYESLIFNLEITTEKRKIKNKKMKQHNFRMSPYFFFLLNTRIVLIVDHFHSLPQNNKLSALLSIVLRPPFFFSFCYFFEHYLTLLLAQTSRSAGYRLTIFSIVVIHQCLLNNLHRPHSLCKRQSKNKHNRQILTKENSLILLFYYQVVSFDFQIGRAHV